MIAWLTDTFLYTAALIALVLGLRRPVARHFGAQMGYALWALPLLRFIMPPVVLPASFAPQSASEAAAPLAALPDAAAPIADAAVAPLDVLPPMDAIAPVAGPSFWDNWGALLVNTALFVWLTGAAVFLLWRFWTYFRMREWLLEAARPVGEAGRIRLVETPAVSAPVAFGVSDQVVALPIGFMASENRAARDLAIEHELAHHRGRDLLANMLAQPILALHWFNPLAWMGWRAMRRDQEAACDARVVARRDPRDRAAYGHVIASFASGQRLALAAPMACPVLGEKSIIHRLRSLSMSDVSPRRRLTGRLLLAGAALALPFTASISYAEAHHGPRAPAAPAAPMAPAAPKQHYSWIDTDGDKTEVTVRVKHTEDGKKVMVVTKTVTDGDAPAAPGKQTVQTVVLGPDQSLTKDQRVAFESMHKDLAEAHWKQYGAQMARRGEEAARQGEQAAEEGEKWAKWGEEYGKQWDEWGKQWDQDGPKLAALAAPAIPAMPALNIAPPAVTVNVQAPQYYGCGKRADADLGARCKEIATASARRALEAARASIAHNRSLDDKTRDEVLDSLDEQIDKLGDNS